MRRAVEVRMFRFGLPEVARGLEWEEVVACAKESLRGVVEGCGGDAGQTEEEMGRVLGDLEDVFVYPMGEGRLGIEVPNSFVRFLWSIHRKTVRILGAVLEAGFVAWVEGDAVVEVGS